MNVKELAYPLDADFILAKKKRLRRELLAEDRAWVEKRVAILGGGTTSDIRLILELFLLDNGIRPTFYESEYNKFYEDAVFGNEELDAFAPDIVYVCTSTRNIKGRPHLSDSEDAVSAMLDDEMARFAAVWNGIRTRYHAAIIQNNFELPHVRLLGNRDAWDHHGMTNFVTRLNAKFADYAASHDNFYLCDINYLSADYGLSKWSDPFYWHMYKYALAVPAIPYLAFNVANIIKSLLGKNKKGMVLDLDNTLWGGVIGDDGPEGIVLGPEESEGQAYMEFQQYIKAHQQLGILLNIDSKNDRENAIAGIRHPSSAFTEDDFIEIEANWEPKDQNFRKIAQALNVLPESLVFIDDNPAERHIVQEQLPGVAAPALTDIAHYAEIIDRSGFFEATNISADDQKRNEMYRENAARARAQSTFKDYGEYLVSLQMKGEIRPFVPLYMARIAQLTNKSNQFNLTTRRYTQTEIEETAKDAGHITLYGKLVDRFGDNGVVSVVIGNIVGDACDIELWIMSCRVLKRDMEFAMMDELVATCRQRGLKKLIGHYYPTKKNKMVKEFYAMQGFTKVEEDAQGNTRWELDIADGYEKKNRYIEVNEEAK